MKSGDNKVELKQRLSHWAVYLQMADRYLPLTLASRLHVCGPALHLGGGPTCVVKCHKMYFNAEQPFIKQLKLKLPPGIGRHHDDKELK